MTAAKGESQVQAFQEEVEHEDESGRSRGHQRTLFHLYAGIKSKAVFTDRILHHTAS